ncbi:MAG TPA: DUF4340 domain-containing protein [Anaerolineales bacterium]|nr:DUF4340 domain-containing protein [Anaerolineales bacterium]
MATRKTTKPTTKKTTRAKSTATQKPNKPIFRTGTWVTILVLAVVIAIAYYLNRNAETTTEAEITPTVEAQFVFDSTKIVKSIEVQPAEGQTIAIERNAENVWVLTQPDAVEADPALAEAAASQLSALRISDEIDGDPSIFGLDAPTYIITVTFDDGTSNTLEVGDSTPTNNGYYVRLDGQDMLIVSLSGIDSLTNLANFPPYLYTPTPTATATPLPTVTPVPAIEATPTP